MTSPAPAHRFRKLAAIAAAGVTIAPDKALAHASDRGFVLLLPTGHYIAGGALAVAASFAALLLLRRGALSGLAAWRLPLFTLRRDWRTATSLMSFAVLAVLVAAGLAGSRDPLSNPLPLSVWTLFWIGLTLVCGAFGNAFAWLEPWRGPLGVAGWTLDRVRMRGARAGAEESAANPLAGLGCAPAMLQFLAFAWFELIYFAPDDPERLAWAVAIYWVVNFLAMLAFGHDRWIRQGECFSVFFRLISRLGIVAAVRTRAGLCLSLCLPGAKLRGIAALPLSGLLFLLAALASVSFDGFMRTFAWLGLIGVNPLEFEGRSSVTAANSAGLAAMVAALAAAFLASVWMGERMARAPVAVPRAAGLLVWSIVPIALAYHFSHYLIALLVNGQYAVAAISDPFSLGWNLFGTADNYISAGLVMGSQAALVLWNLQSAVIVGGHVLAVLIAHGLAGRLHADPRDAFVSQIPLAALMILYTVFGLWLLSTPTGA